MPVRMNGIGRHSTSGDADNAGVMIGEATGLIRDILPAGRIVEDMVSQAERLLAEGPKLTTGLRT